MDLVADKLRRKQVKVRHSLFLFSIFPASSVVEEQRLTWRPTSGSARWPWHPASSRWRGSMACLCATRVAA